MEESSSEINVGKGNIPSPGRRKFLKRFLIGGAGLGIAYVDGFMIEPNDVDITYHNYISDKVISPFRIVHISDLHLDKGKSLEGRAPSLVNRLQPDLLLMTGDYINNFNPTKSEIDYLDRFSSKISAKEGKYASFGNWDIEGKDRMFRNSDVIPLKNEMKSVNIGYNNINIAGLNYESTSNLDNLLGDMDNSRLNILLYHTPDLIEDVAKKDIVDLYLAGHTHGGQVRIPFYGAIASFSKFGKKYESGRYNVENTTLYVNRGLGECREFPKIRLFCKPEITVFDVYPKT
ncbi:MAG: metallophosphoesterase [Nanoarchaeota archaeon]|nr:metallophosphoesterase [Nanoarchaeota archaeon]